MLLSLKENEVAELKRRALEIRSKELDLFTTNLGNLGGLAAFLAASALTALWGGDGEFCAQLLTALC